MITTDNDAIKIIENMLNKPLPNTESKIYKIVLNLLKRYSYVDNQTYPRPSHPLKEKRKDAFFTMASITMSLRTTLENEQKASKTFLERYNSIEEVAHTSVDELASIISSAGMAQKKSQTIINIANYLIDEYDGDITKLNNGTIDEIRDKLLKIPGIGQKSADCLLELGFDLPSMVVDVNVFRVISRMFDIKSDMNINNKDDILLVKKIIEDNIEKDYQIYQIVHTMILLHGKHICKSNPMCSKCDYVAECYYTKTDNLR